MTDNQVTSDTIGNALSQPIDPATLQNAQINGLTILDDIQIMTLAAWAIDDHIKSGRDFSAFTLALWLRSNPKSSHFYISHVENEHNKGIRYWVHEIMDVYLARQTNVPYDAEQRDYNGTLARTYFPKRLLQQAAPAAQTVQPSLPAGEIDWSVYS